MLENLLIGLPTMAFCLLVQALLSVWAIRFYVQRKAHAGRAAFWPSVWDVAGVMLIFVLGNFLQLTVWAIVFRMLGEFESLSVAIYHSAVNFATLGYGDMVMSEAHRLLGPLEAINGVLMIGVSTAGLTAAFQDAARKIIAANRP